MYYLKHRPKTIEDLDNSTARAALLNILQSKNLPHAFLFIGQKGTGKTSAARIFAKSVNCLENAYAGKSTSIEPCNKCSNCIAIDTSSSPDVLEMDAASNRGIDEVRSLIHEASFAPINSRHRIFIIDEAHMITHDAFNALLKTLEEPPSSVIFILATTNEEKVPKTISSRCLKISFGKAKKQDIINKLKKVASKEKIDINEEVMIIISEHAESSFRDAVKTLEELVIQKKLAPEEARTYLGSRSNQNLLKLLEKDSIASVLNWIEEYNQSGGNIQYLIEQLLEQLRLVLLSKSGINTDADFTSSLSPREIAHFMKLLHEAYATLKIAPIESIPLEIAVVEFYNDRKQ